MTYKVICKIDRDDDKGIVEYPIYVKDVENEIDAESTVKRYWIQERPEVGYYGVKSISLI